MKFFPFFKKNNLNKSFPFSEKKIAIPKNLDSNDEISAISGSGSTSFFNNNMSFDGSKFPNALENAGLWDVENLDIDQLRSHSRKLNQRNTIAKAATGKKINTVINSGLTFEAKPIRRILEQDGRPVPDDWDKNVEDRLHLWARSKGVDYSFKKNFYQIQTQAYSDFLINGEVLGILRLNENNNRGRVGRLNIQLINIDRLRTPVDQLEKIRKKGGDIIDGKEIDNTGTIIAYYVYKEKKGNHFDLTKNEKTWVRIPRWAEKTNRSNVIHFFQNDNPDAVSGIPDLTPVIHDLEKIDQFRIYEIQAAIVNGGIALIQNSDGKQPNFDMLKKGVTKQTQTLQNSDGTTTTATTAQTIAPGAHLYATRAGQSLTSFDTKRPNVNFDAFVESISKHVSAAMGIPIEIVFMKFSNNYSASRAALLEFWRFVISNRTNFAWNFCDQVYFAWLNDEILLGRVAAPGWFTENATQQSINQSAWSNAEWHGIAKGSIDPLKEIRAAELAENRSLTTAEKNARELFNTSFDLNVERRLKEAPLQRATIVTDKQTEENSNGNSE